MKSVFYIIESWREKNFHATQQISWPKQLCPTVNNQIVLYYQYMTIHPTLNGRRGQRQHEKDVQTSNIGPWSSQHDQSLSGIQPYLPCLTSSTLYFLFFIFKNKLLNSLFQVARVVVKFHFCHNFIQDVSLGKDKKLFVFVLLSHFFFFKQSIYSFRNRLVFGFFYFTI